MSTRTVSAVVLGIVAVACAINAEHLGHGSPVSIETEASENGSLVVGRVVDRETGEPVGSALVVVDCPCLQGSREVMTNDDGYFALRSLPPGPYSIFTFAASSRVTSKFQLERDHRVRVLVRINTSSMIIT